MPAALQEGENQDMSKLFSKIKTPVNVRLDDFGRWRRRNVSDTPFMFIVVSAIGFISGIGAYVLKNMVGFVSRHLTAHLDAFGANWILLVLPAAGILLTGILTRYILKDRLAHGVRQLREQLKRKDYYIPSSRIITPMIASTITLGFGGSSGSEGPIACTGAAVGGNIGRWLRMSPEMVMLMIGCGAGAGIAGIFKSPLGGALFTLEVMRMPMSTVPVLALIVCTVVAGMTSYALGGFTMDISMADASAAFDTSLIPFIVALGIICGAYSLYYSYIMKCVERWLTRVRNPWIRNLAGGMMLGAAVYMLPSLYGEGYGVIGDVLNGRYGATIADGPFALSHGGVTLLILVSLATVGMKCFATSATNSGGGVAGDFAPTLFAGCILGMLFALTLNELFGTHLPVGMFALYGMAGVMAGAIRAPLMALMLTTEMVGAYSSFFPLLVSVTLSFGIVRLFTADDFYTRHIDRQNGIMSHLLRKQ